MDGLALAQRHPGTVLRGAAVGMVTYLLVLVPTDLLGLLTVEAAAPVLVARTAVIGALSLLAWLIAQRLPRAAPPATEPLMTATAGAAALAVMLVDEHVLVLYRFGVPPSLALDAVAHVIPALIALWGWERLAVRQRAEARAPDSRTDP